MGIHICNMRFFPVDPYGPQPASERERRPPIIRREQGEGRRHQQRDRFREELVQPRPARPGGVRGAQAVAQGHEGHERGEEGRGCGTASAIQKNILQIQVDR